MARTSLDDGGHDWADEPNLDALGIFYITFAILYTLLIIYGLHRLWLIRQTTAIRLRNFWSIFSAVVVMHIYLVFVLLVYPLNGLFKCGIEFWLMSVLLPLGMALFQLSNVRLLSYYDEQQKLVRDYNDYALSTHQTRIPLHKKWCQLSELKKTRVRVTIGITLQLLITTILFFGSRQFHPSYGLFSQAVSAGECRRGYEWIPSVFWQFMWSAVFGPLLILRTRHIHDTHFWTPQMRLTVIASLPGTPLWLAGTYSSSPGFAAMNRWFVPAGWFLPGFITMQLVSIYVPIHDARAMQKLSERLCRGYSNDLVTSLAPTPSPKRPTRHSLLATTQRRDYSLHSLDYQLEHNIEPLLQWAAQKEFTAENVLFLRSVLDWKKKWIPADLANRASVHDIKLAYTEAGRIFLSLVDPQSAALSINIDHRTLKELKIVFGPLVVARNHSVTSSTCSPHDSDSSSPGRSAVAPWEDMEDNISVLPALCPPIAGFQTHPQTDCDSILPVSDKKVIPLVTLQELKRDSTSSEVSSVVQVPPFFGIEVFDKAYGIVRNDVYVNTWSRYEARFSRPLPLRAGSRTGGMVPNPVVSIDCTFQRVFSRAGRAE